MPKKDKQISADLKAKILQELNSGKIMKINRPQESSSSDEDDDDDHLNDSFKLFLEARKNFVVVRPSVIAEESTQIDSTASTCNESTNETVSNESSTVENISKDSLNRCSMALPTPDYSMDSLNRSFSRLNAPSECSSMQTAAFVTANDDTLEDVEYVFGDDMRYCLQPVAPKQPFLSSPGVIMIDSSPENSFTTAAPAQQLESTTSSFHTARTSNDTIDLQHKSTEENLNKSVKLSSSMLSHQPEIEDLDLILIESSPENDPPAVNWPIQTIEDQTNKSAVDLSTTSLSPSTEIEDFDLISIETSPEIDPPAVNLSIQAIEDQTNKSAVNLSRSFVSDAELLAPIKPRKPSRKFFNDNWEETCRNSHAAPQQDSGVNLSAANLSGNSIEQVGSDSLSGGDNKNEEHTENKENERANTLDDVSSAVLDVSGQSFHLFYSPDTEVEDNLPDVLPSARKNEFQWPPSSNEQSNSFHLINTTAASSYCGEEEGPIYQQTVPEPSLNDTIDRMEYMMERGRQIMEEENRRLQTTPQTKSILRQKNDNVCSSSAGAVPKKTPQSLFKKPDLTKIKSASVSKIPKPATQREFKSSQKMSSKNPNFGFKHIVSPIAAYVNNAAPSPLCKNVKSERDFFNTTLSKDSSMMMCRKQSYEDLQKATTSSSAPNTPSLLNRKCYVKAKQRYEINEIATKMPGGQKVQKIVGKLPLVVKHVGQIQLDPVAKELLQRQNHFDLSVSDASFMRNDSVSDFSILDGDVSVHVLKKPDRV